MQSYHHDIPSISNKGKEPIPTSWSTSSQPFPYQRRRPISHSGIARPQAGLNASHSLGIMEVPGRRSSTWTSSSCDRGLLSEHDEVDNREEFVNEYNRLAKKYGIRLFVPGDFPVDSSAPIRKTSWFSKALRRSSSGQSTQTVIVKSDQPLRRRRSISDAALNIVHHQKKDGLENANLQDLVRLCGKSLLYLPPEYTPCSLVLPTCFRALAQALVQQANTRGIFRIPGSIRTVNTLYEYYCADRDTSDISETTRCPNLPNHIKCNTHDVASAFKKFLSGLPGGILGSLSLFDAFVAIHSQLHANPELAKTKETKLRARLIALAIGTVKSQYQREIICAVFGLLCFIGRAAENTPREDEDGRPLPTSGLMGYNALSIIFGPLLINDLIQSYKMKVADPAVGLVLLPVSNPKSRKERRKHRRSRSKATVDDSTSLIAVDKLHIANSIAEMLIVHWREVVRQMRTLGTLKVRRSERNVHHVERRPKLTSSASDTCSLRKPPGWDGPEPFHQKKDRGLYPMARSPIQTPKPSLLEPQFTSEGQLEPLSMKRRQSRRINSIVSTKCLSPTAEESPSTGQAPRRHENLPIRHHGSPLGHGVAGSEMTFHSVRSSFSVLGKDEEYLTGTPRTITPIRSPLSIKDLSNSPTGEHLDVQTRDTSPADKWKALTLASRASTESLARAAKERRMRRSPGNGFFRHTDECLAQRNKRPVTPERKWELTRNKSGSTSMPSKLSPEKKSVFEKSRSESSASPTKNGFDRSRPIPRRSSSKPHNGAVRAMTALFDNAARDSPIGSTAAHSGERRRGSKAPSSILSTHSGKVTPTKSIKSSVSPAASILSKNSDAFKDRFQPVYTPTRNPEFASAVNHSNTSLASSKTTPGDLRTKFPHVSLRSTGSSFSAPKKMPLSSPTPPVPLRDRELSQPPSLGTMIPHQEEPPVAQHITFARPYPFTSPGHYDGDDERVSSGSRPGSSNSMLHVQIRHLQKLLEHRVEENTQLRRQLEARKNMDIGKLCEQLRIAKRETKMWRERAEAAEKRIAVFKQFTARLRGIRDSVSLRDSIQELGGEGQVDGQSHRVTRRGTVGGSVSSSCSGHTLDQGDLNDRIRRNMKKGAAGVSNEKSRSEDDDFWRSGGRTRRDGFWERKISGGRTAQLWDIAEELLMLDEDVK
ncbi:uncharacterized protein F4807DRAFT_8849 [Annulohypoxylon truncatum]|uniref:uncharacterized protein n=1 Tax=Annulohypoxylon truncatum TaxID=327061 RepID=UPI002007DBDF|nr:uncharacterized protein F4807DRAFT_8849 [Annulohypoxylon truncatum]KAI1214792.1 hypothetical protein F4807DRAFT_8849 [Annulohypoxylon truncatum]